MKTTNSENENLNFSDNENLEYERPRRAKTQAEKDADFKQFLKEMQDLADLMKKQTAEMDEIFKVYY